MKDSEYFPLGVVQMQGGSCSFKPDGVFLFIEEIGIIKTICENFWLFYNNIKSE